MKFFFDNNMPRRLAAALSILNDGSDVSVHHHNDDGMFDPGTPDEYWIQELDRQSGWVVISRDVRITRSKAVREVWHESKLTAFFLTAGWGNLLFWDQAWQLIKVWPDILRTARRAERGTGYRVKLKGIRLEKIF